MDYYLAIDIGASSGRHILGWLENGKIFTQEIYRFQNSPITQGESLKWDIEYLEGEVVKGLKRAKELNKTPKFIGIDTWGVDYVLLDEKDKPIEGAVCYRAGRTGKVIDKVHQILRFDDLFNKTGISFNSFNTIYQLYCDKISGRMQRAKSFLMLPDYLHFCLTGVKKQEYTNATTTGMVNAISHTWDKEIIEKLGFNCDLFYSLTQPGNIVGAFSKEIEKQVGFTAEVVLPATHDTASAVLSAPLYGKTPYISSGTWSLLGVENNLAECGKVAMDCSYSNEGSIGFNFRLQKNIMGLWMIQQVRKELDDKYSFEELALLARENVNESEIDVNSPRYLMPKSMIEEICKEVGKTLSVGEIAYCIFNNLAKDYARSLDNLQQITGKQYDSLNIIGGGSKNELLNELTAKYTGKKVITGPTEGTALGNLLMQMLGTKQFADIYEGRQIIRNSFDLGIYGKLKA